MSTKGRLLGFLAAFLIVSILVYYLKSSASKTRQGKRAFRNQLIFFLRLSLTGLLTRQEILDRKLLFHETPPDVRSCNIQKFDSKALIVAIERLLAQKSIKTHHPRPEFFQFDNIDTPPVKMSNALHFAFVGDSRIRQLFTMFMTVRIAQSR